MRRQLLCRCLALSLLAGRFKIEIVEGKHLDEFECSLPAAVR